MPGSLLTKRRISSRNRPFHCSQVNARKSAAELISAGVPGFRDQTQTPQFRISGNFAEQRSIAPVERSIRIAAEHRRQIEAESVDVHFPFPITQAIHHHLAHMRLAEIQGIASAGVIGVGVCRIR